ncbi:CAMK/CAMKL protein kinase [Kwoniella mangroviensis CBS 8886]|nr:CAMK/CAMKL protein kinase [Kwoniella mangroviensis CBS 8886]
MPKDEITQPHPGAGTLYVYGTGRGSSPSGRGRGSRNRSSGRGVSPFGVGLPLIKWDDLVKHHEDPVIAPNPDHLLKHGITEYTYLHSSSGGILGKGKFSTVYKVLGADGVYYALKHTPLYPHHPLISARLLREPTLLAELPSHPCLIGVEGWVRTEGHFYLIEQYASSHVPLPAHSLPLQPSRAAYILDQLVSVVRDTLHEEGRVCHRDLKGDNVLVDVETGEILILDLGLATRFSASEPKLTTCCGSPAFHSPEIVQALAKPPGEITYYGPELDIWCIALTVLSLLLQVKFPLGPKHTSPYVMRERVRDRLQELDEMYPPHSPWRPPKSSSFSNLDLDFEKKEWSRVRRAMRDFLEIDGKVRMHKFGLYQLGDKIKQRVSDWDEKEQSRRFKSTSFIESEIKYTLPIWLDDQDSTNTNSHGKKGKIKKDQIILRNPMGESERRCKSYIKYLLRSAGILYHLLPTTQRPSTPSTPTTPTNITIGKEYTIFQLVMNVPYDTPSDSQPTTPNDPQIGWFPSLFSFHKKPPPLNSAPTSPQQRSVSLPPSRRSQNPTNGSQVRTRDKSPKRVLRCYIKLEFVHPPQTSPILDKRRGSVETFTSYRDGWGGSIAPLHPVTSTTTQHTATTTPNKNYAFPARSVSVSRPPPNRPGYRRSVSHAPSAHPRQPLTRVSTTSSIHTAPLSPLSRQVSLSDSPPDVTPGQLQPLSRASSRSRQSSLGYSYHPHHNGVGLGGHNEGKIIVHLSDPRSYPILKKALDIKPNMNSNNNSDLNLLSPMTIRRPSLAPSAADPETGTENNSSEDERGVQEERGRPRSKDSNHSNSSILQLQQIKSRNNSIKVKHVPLPVISPEMGDQIALDVKHVEVDQEKEKESKKHKNRGLLDVIFGTTRTGTTDDESSPSSSGLGMSLGTGYGRAMRAKSVPPYRGVDELI